MEHIRVAYIENAYDPYHDQASLDEGRYNLRRHGYVFELVTSANGEKNSTGYAPTSRDSTRSS